MLGPFGSHLEREELLEAVCVSYVMIILRPVETIAKPKFAPDFGMLQLRFFNFLDRNGRSEGGNGFKEMQQCTESLLVCLLQLMHSLHTASRTSGCVWLCNDASFPSG